MWENEWHYLDHIECYWNAYSVPILCTEYAVYSVLEYREKNQHSRFFFKKYMGLEKYYTTTHIQHNIYNTRLQFFLFGNHWFLVPQTNHQQGPGVQVTYSIPRTGEHCDHNTQHTSGHDVMISFLRTMWALGSNIKTGRKFKKRGPSQTGNHQMIHSQKHNSIINEILYSKIHMEGKEEVRQNDDSPWLMLCVSK